MRAILQVTGYYSGHWVWKSIILLKLLAHLPRANELTHPPLRDLALISNVVFKLISRIHIFIISCELALRWILQDLINNKSTSVRAIAWCCRAANHYPSQCWPGSLSPIGNKPLPEPMFTQIYVAIRQQAITRANGDQKLCHHMASLGHNKLIYSTI